MQRLYIIGICGTAMAAIAKLAQDLGWQVTGSDTAVYPPMSDFLASQHISVHEGFDACHLQPRPDLVVIGNALSRGNVEVEAVLDQQLAYISGAQFVGEKILANRSPIVVAGTHGKTSSASMLAHLLEVSGQQPGFLIGGIPENFSSGAQLGTGTHFVVEGDEYDTAFFDKRSKFLHYRPKTIILNNLEYDHADIFPDLNAIKTQFHHLVRTLPASGNMIVNADDANLSDVLKKGCWTPCTSFAELGHADAEWHWHANEQDGSNFSLYHHGHKFVDVTWNMIGKHHVANACGVTVAAIATVPTLSAPTIAQAFSQFRGVQRRMTLVGEAQGIKIYDDFAHHPTAIFGIVTSMRSHLQHGERLWIIIEPRSNTMRSNVHQSRLAKCFEGADFVCFSRPSTRGLEAGEQLDIEAICETIGSHAWVEENSHAIIRTVVEKAKSQDHIVILSNGGFDHIHQKMLQALQPQVDEQSLAGS
ncbi:MAG: UDP-N-acetylmuramate:L-alanyl-gamma-D-glutamyl-meso-diaminopimelate ligase [Mariprofundaceae bacterium]